VTRLTVVPLRSSLIQGNDENLGPLSAPHAGTLTCYREPGGVSAQKGSLYIEKFRNSAGAHILQVWWELLTHAGTDRRSRQTVKR
jgi:hypothetical protein